VCGRFVLTRSGKEIAEHFGLDETPELARRWNVAPSQEVAVVRHSRSRGARVLERRHWGLVPPWAPSSSGRTGWINARVETLAERPAFRDAFRRRRGLVPADGFYEWTQAGGRRRPHFVSLPEGALFGMAAVLARWRGEGGEVVDSCAIVTAPALGAVSELHDRMPVIVDPRDYAAWLDPEAGDPDALRTLLTPRLGERLAHRAVGGRVNDPRNEGAECLAPEAAAPTQALLF
jgi:putative SOS response-associated peptidase YedK